MFNLDSIIKVIIKLNVKEPYSFLTLTFPKPLNILHKNYPKLLQKFLKISKLKDYIYVYEYKENNFHIHIICLYDYKENFFNLKNIWSTALKESSTCRKYDCTNSLNYSEIRDINSSVYYIFKDFKLTEIAEFRDKYKTLLDQKSRLFGGSSSFQRCFSDFRKILSHELSKLNDVLSDNFSQADNAFEDIFVSIKKKYILQNPEANEIFLRSQFENECNAYSCVLSQYNFTKFCEFVLSGQSCLGHHTLDFYHFLKDLLLRNNVLDLVKEHLETTFHSDYLKTKSPIVEEFLCKFFGYNLVEKKFNITFTTDPKSFLLYRLINIIYIIYRYQYHKRLSFIILRLADFMMVVVSSTKKKCINTEYNINDRIRLGYFLFEFLRQNVFCKISDYLILHKMLYEKKINFLNIDEGRSVYENSEFAESSLAIFEELTVFLEFTNLAKDQFFSKYKTLFLSATNEFTFHYPFLIAPKNWDFTVDLVSDNVEFNDATLNTTGGLLINNYLSHTSLCRVPPYTSHKLFITRRIVDLVNKMQSIPFCLDIDLYNLYISHKTELPDYLSNKIKILNQKKLYEINIVISKCYKEMNELRLNSKLSVFKRAEKFDCLTILRDKTLGERATLLGKLDKHRLLVRLLSYFENIKKYDTFYYYYFLDFRMRLYPCPVKVSYMGSKFARSLIRFSEKFPFVERAFKIYAVMQYIDCREKNEYEILSYFDSNLSLLLSDFENSFVFEKIRNAREPFLLLSCAVEWKRYQQHKNSGILEPYLSNFPIYLDCTSNGPQLISLLFALDSFADWLNLVKQSPFDVRGDFYTSLIKKFLCYLSKTTIPPDINITIPVPVAVLAVLRKSLKSVIMTQFYGISFNKFSALIKSHFQKFEYRSLLIDYFIISPSDNKKISRDSLYREFIIFFVKEFWNFLHNQSLFQLKSILKTFHDLYYKSKSSNKKKGPLYWSVFDMNKIFLHYNKLRKFQVDAKALKSRHQFVLYKQIKNELSSKQFSSLMANFIHSLDGYVLFRLLDSVNFPIMAVHDSFAVHSCHVDALKEKVREIFGDLVDNHKAFSYFVQQMSHILEKDLGLEVKDKFLEFVRTNIELGKLNKKDVLESYYCINYS